MTVSKDDFKIPCSYENRKPYLLEQLFYLPKNFTSYEQYAFPDLLDNFSKNQPIAVEYCSGNGEWICQKAMESLETNWIAVERDFDRARKIWLRIKRGGLKNILVVFGDAKEFTQFYLPNRSISQVYINFPDPWPKRRHAKNRLISFTFIRELLRICKPGKTVTFVTDDQNYSLQTIHTFLQERQWESCFKDPYFVQSLEDFGSSYFFDLWINQGRQIYYHQFRRKEHV